MNLEKEENRMVFYAELKSIVLAKQVNAFTAKQYGYCHVAAAEQSNVIYNKD
jgi:hypothetical protein